MKKNIINKLKAIEKEYQVKILHACEAGSRAWGFPSPDSDYDVRFIYRKQTDAYLSLFKKSDVINPEINGDFDAGGWDIDKSLLLLAKSNVPLMEWIYSPLVYFMDQDFLEKLRGLAKLHFAPPAAFYHYQSMAKKYHALCDADRYRLKDLFYALRTSLAAHWVFKYQTFPPVNFTEMLKSLSLPSEVLEGINELRVLKSVKEESYQHPSSKRLLTFLEELIESNEQASKALVSPEKDMHLLDSFFRETVKSD
ncbi:nucleotidyltransferase domain-containing protein [Porifericola rhodea]|uniref:nucleotidyltransferase domain-containing protein n=1 Tax=Porifericola rhodea TaxID=930972 RepID=UPI0026657F37|nr:nucleotidyltransferase domain-containing protein [Porifericola rhodea]WKN33791.1 nucleotidyltransferase domain-containing protein [Porifericola rhodea]